MTKFTYKQKPAAVKLYLEGKVQEDKYLRYYSFERIRHTLKGKTPIEY